MESGLKEEFMRDKACVIYNISDADHPFQSSQSITDYELDPDILQLLLAQTLDLRKLFQTNRYYAYFK